MPSRARMGKCAGHGTAGSRRNLPGRKCANVTREALDKSGATLEQLFFRVTENAADTAEKIGGGEQEK